MSRVIALRAILAFRLFATLLLATIGLQAVPAMALAPTPDRGSAFSSDTSAVAVLTLRRDAGPQGHQGAEPGFGPVPPATRPARPIGRQAAQVPSFVPAYAVPPPHDLRADDALPRAPPAH